MQNFCIDKVESPHTTADSPSNTRFGDPPQGVRKENQKNPLSFRMRVPDFAAASSDEMIGTIPNPQKLGKR